MLLLYVEQGPCFHTNIVSFMLLLYLCSQDTQQQGLMCRSTPNAEHRVYIFLILRAVNISTRLITLVQST